MANKQAIARREMKENPNEFADLYRDIRGQFTKGKPVQVVLRHIRAQGGDADVETWTTEFFEGLDPNDFTEAVVASITEDARIFSGVQRYGIFFYRKSTQKYDARILLTFAGQAQDEQGSVGWESEGASDQGRAAQLMRHDEAFARLTFGAIKDALASKDAQLSRMEGMVEKFLTTHVSMLENIQSLMDRTAERDIRVERTKKNYELMDQGLDKLMQFAPFLLVAKFEKTNPKLAELIRKAAINPAGDILKILMQDMENNPERAQEIMQGVLTLPNGPAVVQALQQLSQAEKQANASSLSKNGGE